MSDGLLPCVEVEPEGEAREAQLETVAALLLSAALRGVCEVGMHDGWTAIRSQRMPDGIIAVEAGSISPTIPQMGKSSRYIW